MSHEQRIGSFDKRWVQGDLTIVS